MQPFPRISTAFKSPRCRDRICPHGTGISRNIQVGRVSSAANTSRRTGDADRPLWRASHPYPDTHSATTANPTRLRQLPMLRLIGTSLLPGWPRHGLTGPRSGRKRHARKEAPQLFIPHAYLVGPFLANGHTRECGHGRHDGRTLGNLCRRRGRTFGDRGQVGEIAL